MTVLALPPEPPVGSEVTGELGGRTIRYWHEQIDPADPEHWEWQDGAGASGWMTWPQVLAGHPAGVTLTGNLPADDPAADPVGAVRVHPDDNPEDPGARRRFRDDDTGARTRWALITGWGRPSRDEADLRDDELQGWRRQDLVDVARILGHPGCDGEDPRARLAGLEGQLRRALAVDGDEAWQYLLERVRSLRYRAAALAATAEDYAARVDRARVILTEPAARP